MGHGSSPDFVHLIVDGTWELSRFCPSSSNAVDNNPKANHIGYHLLRVLVVISRSTNDLVVAKCSTHSALPSRAQAASIIMVTDSPM